MLPARAGALNNVRSFLCSLYVYLRCRHTQHTAESRILDRTPVQSLRSWPHHSGHRTRAPCLCFSAGVLYYYALRRSELPLLARPAPYLCTSLTPSFGVDSIAYLHTNIVLLRCIRSVS